MSARPCERCGAPPPTITSGPWAGDSSMHDYCGHCSKDLCDKCLKTGKCRDSADGKHHSENAEEEPP